LAGLRDKAVLLVGFAGAFRRSELVAIDLCDLSLSEAGLVITIRRSKTDQEGAGREVGIPRSRKSSITCPVAALEAWLRESDWAYGRPPAFLALPPPVV
jgi:integrase